MREAQCRHWFPENCPSRCVIGFAISRSLLAAGWGGRSRRGPNRPGRQVRGFLADTPHSTFRRQGARGEACWVPVPAD